MNKYTALYEEIQSTYHPPFHAGMTTGEMLAALNRDADIIHSRQNFLGDELTPEQYRQDVQHGMDREYIEILLADRGLALVDTDGVHWTTVSREAHDGTLR